MKVQHTDEEPIYVIITTLKRYMKTLEIQQKEIHQADKLFTLSLFLMTAANIKTTVGVTACREIICPDDEKAPTSGVPWKSYPNFNNATSELEFATTATKRIHWQLLMAISKMHTRNLELLLKST